MTGRTVVWTLWLLRAASVVLQVLFVVYFVCVQINAIAYLAGQGSAVISGASPPIRISSGAAAAADIVIGLIIEAAVALIMGIITAVALSRLKERHR